MKYLALLWIPILFSCQSNSSGQQDAETADADSALYAPMVLPLTDSLTQFPNDADLHFRRALLLFNTDPALAQKDFEKAASIKPNVTDYWAGAGEAAILVEKYPQAVANFEKALKTSPSYPYLEYRLATALIENKQYKRADSLASVLAASKDTHDKAYYLKARIAEERKDTALAIKHLTTAIDAAGMQSDYDAVMELGDLLQERHLPAAVHYYELASRLDSSNADAQYAIGQYYEKDNKLPEAIAAYKSGIVIDPDDEDIYIALGKIYYRQQQWPAAFNYFNLAAKSSPADAEAYYYRARCNEKLGRKLAAIDDYTKALNFRRKYPEAKAALDSLKNK
jgi:tetratricopeptide (TPR) repeat protein